MIVVDEYLALRIMAGRWPPDLPDDDAGLPITRHWRLLQRVHRPGTGQLSRRLAQLSPSDRDIVQHPHPEVLQVLDARSFLDEAAEIASRFGGNLLTSETLTAGLHHGRQLWFGFADNVGPIIAGAASELAIEVRVLAE